MSVISHSQPVSKQALTLGLIVVVAVGLRLGLALTFPLEIGDSDIYATVAENIMRHGCVSVSDPATGACLPHWGGNQLPGFPAFVALAWIVGGGWREAPLVLQSLVAGVAIWRLMCALIDGKVAFRAWALCGGVLALSPIALPFSRILWTESLAISLTIWTLAECIFGLARRHLSIFALAGVLTAALFVRLDGALLFAAVAVVAWRIYGWRRAIFRLILVGALVGTAFGAWAWRSNSQGLGWLPRVIYDAESGTPESFVAWTRSWMTNQYELEAVNWPAIQRDYAAMRIPGHAYVDDAEKRQVERLIDRLREHAGNPMPRDIADEFATLAEARKSGDPLGYWILVPAKRAIWLWLNPFTALGWPGKASAILKDQLLSALKSGQPLAAFSAAQEDIVQLAIRGTNVAYRGALVLGIFFLIGRLAYRHRFAGNIVAEAAIAYAIVRTAAFALTGGVETRYVVEAVPPLEVALVLCAVSLRQAR